jgi:hypothetical protein
VPLDYEPESLPHDHERSVRKGWSFILLLIRTEACIERERERQRGREREAGSGGCVIP